MRTPPPFPDPFRIARGRKAARKTTGCFLTRFVTFPLSIHKMRGRKHSDRLLEYGKFDYMPMLVKSVVIYEVRTDLHVPPNLASIGLVVEWHFCSICTQKLSNW